MWQLYHLVRSLLYTASGLRIKLDSFNLFYYLFILAVYRPFDRPLDHLDHFDSQTHNVTTTQSLRLINAS